MLRTTAIDASASLDAPRVLFVGLVNDVASDRIVTAMSKLGARCAVMSAPDAFAATTRHAERVFPLPRRGGPWARSLVIGRRLATAQRAFRPDLVIPLDEMSAQTLRSPRLYARADHDLKALIEASLGCPDRFALACDRHRLIETADALGLATPTQVAIADLASARTAAAKLGYPLVLKREQTCGGAGVQVIHHQAELITAYRRAAATAARKRRLQALLGRAATHDVPLVMQRFVAGPLAFRILACKDGQVLDAVSLLSECVHPPVTGASTIVAPIERPDMDAAAATLVRALGCSGFVALDFLLPNDGPAVLIEMNARPVASGHLGRLFGHDIHAAMLEAVRGVAPAEAGASSPMPTRVALFPRELDRNPAAIMRREPGLLHDVPWDDPASVASHAAWLCKRHRSSAALLSRRLGIAAVPAPRRESRMARLYGLAARLLHVDRTASAK